MKLGVRAYLGHERVYRLADRLMNPAIKRMPLVGSGSKNIVEREPTGDDKQSVKRVEDAILRTTAISGSAVSQSLVLPETVFAVAQNTTPAGPVLLIPSAYVRLDPKLIDLNQQLASQSHSSSTVMAIKREHNNNNSNCSDSSTFTADDFDESSTDSMSSSKMARMDVAVDYSLASGGSSTNKQHAAKSHGPRRHTGPRKPRGHEKLSPEEEERRRVRRERNKHAAAKCRQKRVDLTNQLLAETEKLESEQAKLHADIKAFQHEKDELEFILEAHRLHCGIGKANGVASAATAAKGVIKLGLPDKKEVLVITSDNSKAPEFAVNVSTDISNNTTTNAVRRPNSLVTRFVNDVASSSSQGAGQIAGIAITTPSSGLNVYTLGLESMMDGHTGLTPITGLPVAYAGLSTPLMIAGISGNQLLLAGNQPLQQSVTDDTVSTPCKTDSFATEIL